ncbi:MAG: hypothetical protein WCI95_07070, partial [bacterium]
MNHVELEFDHEHPPLPGAPPVEGLDRDILLQNARWFTRIRWVVVGVLLVFGVLSRGFPATMAHLSMVPAAWWPLILAGGLAGLNLVFVFFLRPTHP